MDNTTQQNNIKLIESKLKKILLELEDKASLENPQSFKNRLSELKKENSKMKQKVTSYMVALMHQRRKAAQNVDDQYFEHEVFIEAHEELEAEIQKQLEKLTT